MLSGSTKHLFFLSVAAMFTMNIAPAFTLSFKPFIGTKPFYLNHRYVLGNDSISIETCRFYISEIKVVKDEKVVFKEKDSYHLLDLEAPASLQLSLPETLEKDVTEIQFLLGIDSMTNVSGAYGGDLDPTKGMYWTWQSGYINFKLEGHCYLSSGQTKEIVFHLGGYQYPYQTCREIALRGNFSSTIDIRIDLEEFLKSANIQTAGEIMSPGKQAVELTEKLTGIFSIR